MSPLCFIQARARQVPHYPPPSLEAHPLPARPPLSSIESGLTRARPESPRIWGSPRGSLSERLGSRSGKEQGLAAAGGSSLAHPVCTVRPCRLLVQVEVPPDRPQHGPVATSRRNPQQLFPFTSIPCHPHLPPRPFVHPRGHPPLLLRRQVPL